MRNRFYARAARESIRNSMVLAESGESEIRAGRFGVAVALLVLACEEFAKGMLYSSVADGTASLDPNDLGKKWVVNPDAPRSHALKQLFAGGAFITPALVASLNKRWPEIKQRLSTMDLPNPGTKEFEDVVRRIVYEFFPKTREDPEAERRAALIRRLDSLKLAGLYVEVKADSITSPSEVAREDAVEVLRLYDELLANYSERGLFGVPEHLLARRLPLRMLFPGGQKHTSFSRETKHSKRKSS